MVGVGAVGGGWWETAVLSRVASNDQVLNERLFRAGIHSATKCALVEYVNSACTTAYFCGVSSASHVATVRGGNRR